MGFWSRLRGALAREAQITSAEDLLALSRGLRTGAGGVTVTNDTALRHSAVWACLRLRADLVSTMPVDVYRRVAGVQVEVPAPPVLVSPGGQRVGIKEWLYSTQVDLDRAGNCFGLVTERSGVPGPDGHNLPSRIDLVALSDVTVRATGAQITKYVIAGVEYDPHEVWHEKQFTVAGLPLGLSPVAYAAWTIEENLNASRFAKDWFAGGAVPLAELKNTAKKINPDEARIAKDAFKASVANGDLFVHGHDWEYKPIQAVAQQSAFIEARQFGLTDIARFFGCPSDLIDAAVSTGHITYASITQRNLQFLIMNLGPAVSRREDALTRGLVPGPRYVKLNRSALLAMDPEARARTLQTRINSRTLTPNEARALEDLPPLTPEQIAEFEALFGVPRTTPTTATSGAA
ncbi:HK97 family phage portal protein [Thermocatellispora tengchongensis]|uniref:HK97 family phage portal protein n=1 Tax=Thermocatellispora tengchongensis TaxID=1073253 RepID=A0A840NXZ8_9ACTN|nr:phage portal protein [Thermocatellispora tengchongensis]MBB5130531.1 HK97 family phage portal protein [Thermocatellispora tengchongensis]